MRRRRRQIGGFAFLGGIIRARPRRQIIIRRFVQLLYQLARRCLEERKNEVRVFAQVPCPLEKRKGTVRFAAKVKLIAQKEEKACIDPVVANGLGEPFQVRKP